MTDKTNAMFPPPLLQRVLALEAPGGDPAVLNLIAPTVVAAGEAFTVKLAVLDRLGYPSVTCRGTVRIAGDFAQPAEGGVTFAAGMPAVAALGPFRITEPGFYRFQAEFEGLRAWSNPVLCAPGKPVRVLWGDPHVHTILGRCHSNTCRTLNFAYTAARYLSGLNWMAAADHVSNGRCDAATWKEQARACNLFDSPPDFATLPAYEASLKGGAGGDCIVYMLRHPDLFVDDYETGDLASLCRKLAGILPPESFFAIPHHTTRTNKHGEISDAIYPGPDWMPLIEIHSKWGTSEYRGNPNALHKVHPGPSYAVDLLNRGLQFGFVAGTDTHASMPSGGGEEPGHIDRLPGMTAVLAPAAERGGIFDALRGRRCYAASGERIYLEAGIEQKGDTRTVEVRAAGKSDITSVEIVRNGMVIHRQAGSGWCETLRFTDGDSAASVALESPNRGRFIYYYVRVTCASGAQAWSSPVWLAV